MLIQHCCFFSFAYSREEYFPNQALTNQAAQFYAQSPVPEDRGNVLTFAYHFFFLFWGGGDTINYYTI